MKICTTIILMMFSFTTVAHETCAQKLRNLAMVDQCFLGVMSITGLGILLAPEFCPRIANASRNARLLEAVEDLSREKKSAIRLQRFYDKLTDKFGHIDLDEDEVKTVLQDFNRNAVKMNLCTESLIDTRSALMDAVFKNGVLDHFSKLKTAYAQKIRATNLDSFDHVIELSE